MNWLDKAIAYVAPQTALQRVKARATLERVNRQALAYDAARRDGRTNGWRTTATSANAELDAALPTMRDRSRDHCRNSGLAAKARGEFARKVVGYGIAVNFTAKDAKVAEQVNQLWADSGPQLSADGLPTETAMQVLGAQALFESGEYLIRRRVRRADDNLKVPVQFQILECDLLDHMKNGPLANGNKAVNGVEFNAIGQRVAYWLYPEHPGNRSILGAGVASWQSRPVPAEEISHVYRPDRPGQVRGVPQLHAVMQRLRDREDLVEAELVRKKGEACIMAFVAQREGDGAPISNAAVRQDGVRAEQLEPGMIVYGRDGEDIKFNDPKANGSFGEYLRAYDRDVAAGVHMPYEILTGDLSQVNYSSYRGGLLSFQDYVEDWQWNWFIPLHVEWVVRRWLEIAYLAGVAPDPALVGLKWQFQPPAFDLYDRGEEAKADREQIRSGTLDWGAAVMRQGENPHAQLARIKYWNQQFDQAGVVLDVDPRKVSQQGQAQEAASA